jgi:hypothetical protein
MKAHSLVWPLLVSPLLMAAEPSAPPSSHKPANLALKSESVKEILRVSAATQDAARPAQTAIDKSAPLTETELANEKLRRIDFAAARQVTVYREKDDLLRRMYREQMRDQTIVTNPDSYDAWLSCQDTNDLMTTFERFDNCQSVKLDLYLDRQTARDAGVPLRRR